mmetsp:Transcript_70915/g.148341  ORF Transcript_70915/g.148341 Transcript_70915/m.148341 type:complete len:352 (-) Transcript_70915:82-1137(-)
MAEEPKGKAVDLNLTMSFSTISRNLIVCLLYIAVSATIIRYNKFLMSEDRFPHSMFLTSCHMGVSFVCCSLIYLVRPDLLPGIQRCEGQKMTVLKYMVPIGAAFAVSLYASNQAYMYCSVSFLQFMKEGNIILALLLSCALGLQVITRTRIFVIFWIMLGASMAVSGEMHFAWIGFFFQLVSQCAECSRNVLGEVVLSGSDLKLDPLSYTLFVAPTCLLVLIVGTITTWSPDILVDLGKWWHYVLPNAFLAFALNIVVAFTIKEISAVGFVLAGVCKDICIVLISCMFFGEQVTAKQILGFVVAASGVFFWSYMRVAPSTQAVQLLNDLLMTPKENKEPNEKTSLRESNKV